jgi:glutamate-1-semialdehyde 2,1-aminomutase
MTTMNLTNSKANYEKACQVLAGGVSSGIRMWADPILYFSHANGPYFYDVDNQEYIDYTLAWGPLILGSNHPAINAAVSAQIQKSYTLGAQHQLEIDLATKLVSVLPGVDQMIFSNTGSEAVQAAIRIARATTGRNKIVKFEGHYHGWLNNILVSFHPPKEQLGIPSPTTQGQPESEYQDTLVLPWNDPDALKNLLETRGHEIACVITEPLLANSGSCVAQEGFLNTLVDSCRSAGVISIFDEVITGFRIALGGAREHFGVIPDLSVYAKAMAGGFTMGAVGGRKEIFDVLREGKAVHAGTYNGSSFNLAAALATVTTLEAEKPYEGMHQHGYAIRAKFEELAKQKGIPLITTGLGSVFSAHFGLTTAPLNYTDTLEIDADLYKRFRQSLLERGIHPLPDGRWYISAVHTEKELARTLEAIEKSFAEL